MYSREEASKSRKHFWTTFGQYLGHQLSAEGLKVNWINYKTGLKDVYFRMDAIKKEVSIGIELHHQDEGIRELYFEQFLELQTYFHTIMDEEWIWDKHYTITDSNKTISRIYQIQHGHSIFNQAQWPEVIQFLKPRLIKLDEFWSDAQYSFDALR